MKVLWHFGILLLILPTVISKECHFTITGLSYLDKFHKIIHELNVSHKFDASLMKEAPYFMAPMSVRELKTVIRDKNSDWLVRLQVHEAISVEKKRIPRVSPMNPKTTTELEEDIVYAKLAHSRAEQLKMQLNFNDPHIGWQLINDGHGRYTANAGFDLNVFPVYQAGYSGKGVVIVIVDDALDTRNTDLKDNIDMRFTADLLNKNRKGPRGTDFMMKKENDHGTEVAGLAAAVANNSECSFGVAYGATLGGIRLLGDHVTDLMVGEALVRFAKDAQIYISSWGPVDDGYTWRMPGKFMNKALHHSTTKGNHGKGSVFFFSSGNGGNNEDNCGADGFVNHHAIVAVNAVSEFGDAPAYAEACSAVTISVPVGGSPSPSQFKKDMMEEKISVPTTAINNRCTDQFFGTSAANPIAAGAVALAMEANPQMTLRDIQALLSFSGRIPSPRNRGWYINGAGMLVSHTFGSGMLDAAKMVNLAIHWTNVGPLKTCHLNQGKRWNKHNLKKESFKKLMSSYKKLEKLHRGRSARILFSVTPSDCDVEVLEMPIVHLQWVHIDRGALEVYLTSPSGLTATLLGKRSKDHDSGASEFTWKSLLHASEHTYGTWIVTVKDTRRRRSSNRLSGFIRFASLEFRGTSESTSAYELNKNYIKPTMHWLQSDRRAMQKALKLTEKTTAMIYDFQRWRVLNETVEHKPEA